jgi:hypothetical protein
MRGIKKRYFKLSIITIYSSLSTLSSIEFRFIYHRLAFGFIYHNKDPPYTNNISITNKNIFKRDKYAYRSWNR